MSAKNHQTKLAATRVIHKIVYNSYFTNEQLIKHKLAINLDIVCVQM